MLIPSYLRDWAEQVHSIAAALDATLVVLGRDAWPLVAWLRSQGKPCQYFLCSRLQVGSESTRLQWLAEVPPGAFVVDTGFRGSIVEWLRSVDPTIVGGALMAASSDASVPQVGRGEHGPIVESIEYLPKHHDRTVGYDADGRAVVSEFERGDTDGASVDSDNAGLTGYLLLREMGLTAEQARRYAQFTGLVEEERIGVAGQGQVREHLFQVRKQRRERDTWQLDDFLRHGQIGDLDRVLRIHAGVIWANRQQVWAAWQIAQHKLDCIAHDARRLPAWDLDQAEELHQRRLRWQRRLVLAYRLWVATCTSWHQETNWSTETPF